MWVAARVGYPSNFTTLEEYCNWILLFEDLNHIHPTWRKALGIHKEAAVMPVQKVVWWDIWFKTKQIRKINIKWRRIWQLNKGKKRDVVMTPGLFSSQECLISGGTQRCRDDIHELFSHVEFAPLLWETVHVPTILNYTHLCWHFVLWLWCWQ